MKLELEGAISVVAYDATSGTEHIHNVRTSTRRARLSGLKRGGSGRRLASEGVVAAAFIVSARIRDGAGVASGLRPRC